MNLRLYSHSNADKPPLRVGLMLNGLNQPRWIAEMVDQIQESNYAWIELLILHDREAKPAEPRAGFFTRVIRTLFHREARRGFLYSLYRGKIDRQNDPSVDPFASVGCSDRLRNTPKLLVRPITKRFVHRSLLKRWMRSRLRTWTWWSAADSIFCEGTS